jgi:hypothetical protein
MNTSQRFVRYVKASYRCTYCYIFSFYFAQVPRKMLSCISSFYRHLFAWSGLKLREVDYGNSAVTSLTIQELTDRSSGHVMLVCDGPNLAEREELRQIFRPAQVRGLLVLIGLKTANKIVLIASNTVFFIKASRTVS